MTNLVYSFEYNRDYEPPAPILEVGISLPRQDQPTVTISGLLDSGSDGTMLPISILENIGAKPVGRGRIRGILGNSTAASIFLVKLYLGNQQIYAVRVIGVDEESECLIGRNVLRHLVVTLNGLASVTEIST